MGKVKLKKSSSTVAVTNTNSETELTQERFPTMSGFLRSFDVHDMRKQGGKARLGTLLGVYLPSIQHVFGVLIFLRLPWCVGIMGIPQAFLMVFIAVTVTFTAVTSLSAVVTNGKTGRGGPYFLLSRSLGPATGSALGILVCLANTIACALYVIGGLEILLITLAPQLIFGKGTTEHIITETQFFGQMTNNYRAYGCAMSLAVFLVVIAGVRFTQLFAPLSLFCVVISILSLYAGAIEKSIRTGGPSICLLGDTLLREDALLGKSLSHLDVNVCNYCKKNSTLPIFKHFCNKTGQPPNMTFSCLPIWNNNEFVCEKGFPGIASGVIKENIHPDYLKINQTTAKQRSTFNGADVIQDLSTSFFICLAIYFPSVTGIKTGANMSGDLKRPQKSIPKGTMAAHLTTSLVYMTYVFMCGSVAHRALLQDKYGTSLGGSMPIGHLAWPHYLVVVIGGFTSTFGAAIQSMCSAPKLLQSIAEDDVIPFLRPFAKTVRNEPLFGQILVFAIEISFVLVARLDYVAPFVTHCFLTTYAGLNMSCVICSLVGFPSWRPRFRFYNIYFSFFGFLLAVFLMFASEWLYTIICILIFIIVYVYVILRGNKKEYGDSVGGLQASFAHYSLTTKRHKAKKVTLNWKPRLLVISQRMVDDDRLAYQKLLWAAFQIAHYRLKLFTVATTLVPGDPCKPDCYLSQIREKQKIRKMMKDVHLKGYAKPIIYIEDSPLSECLSTMLTGCVLGRLRPNTLMISLPSTTEQNEQLWSEIVLGSLNNMTLLVPKGEFPCLCTSKLKGHIDVWWIIEDGDLLLKLALIVQANKIWRHCALRLHMVIEQEDDCVKIEEMVEKCLNDLKLKKKVHLETVLIPIKRIGPYIYQRALRKQRRWEELKQTGTTQMKAKQKLQLIADNYVYANENVEVDMKCDLSTALWLNERINEKSKNSELVIINLPISESVEGLGHYLDYMTNLCQGLNRVLLVRGTGKELI